MLEQVGAGFEKKSVGEDGPTLIVEVPGSRTVGITPLPGHFFDSILQGHIATSFSGRCH
jgi:hypothetical protein